MQEGNWCYGLQEKLEEDSPKKRKGQVVEVHMELLGDSQRYRVPGVVEVQSSLEFHRVHERLGKVLRSRSSKTHEIDCGTK